MGGAGQGGGYIWKTESGGSLAPPPPRPRLLFKGGTIQKGGGLQKLVTCNVK